MSSIQRSAESADICALSDACHLLTQLHVVSRDGDQEGETPRGLRDIVRQLDSVLPQFAVGERVFGVSLLERRRENKFSLADMQKRIFAAAEGVRRYLQSLEKSAEGDPCQLLLKPLQDMGEALPRLQALTAGSCTEICRQALHERDAPVVEALITLVRSERLASTFQKEAERAGLLKSGNCKEFV